MSEDDIIVKCRECDAAFTMFWELSWQTDGGPNYCPFCGEWMDYE